MSQPAITSKTQGTIKSKQKNTWLSFYKPAKAKLSYEDAKIIMALEELKQALDFAHSSLDNITDELLIDSYIFEIQALHKKYEYYLQLCKDKGIIAEMM